jgi:hypothetical protein
MATGEVTKFISLKFRRGSGESFEIAVIIVSDVECYWAIMHEKPSRFNSVNNTCRYCLIKCSNNSIDGSFARDSNPNPKVINFHYQLSSISRMCFPSLDGFQSFSVRFEESEAFYFQVCFKRQIKRFAIPDCFVCLLSPVFIFREINYFFRYATTLFEALPWGVEAALEHSAKRFHENRNSTHKCFSRVF